SRGESESLAGDEPENCRIIVFGEDGDERWTASTAASHNRHSAESFLCTRYQSAHWKVPRTGTGKSEGGGRRAAPRHDQTIRSQEGGVGSPERVARPLEHILPATPRHTQLYADSL